ncbi:PhzF family isomerase [Clostridium beijerinckii]|uniref:PhzF family phenazine biosynthesis protein n=1 Tax=Clostridium beijerinckii TaxID=1520 RepID=A0A9Q5GLX5_CLOBE|nr:PhzF family isomerase [Clostridium beijerinckii]AQS06259.1 putative isomerase YddE [Clostridium beijerinckii]MBA2886297.1 PhzF family phenazine biosynthesis protein [Clostridium beijerinckii]MBA2900845.1 PhzF family phenazine biosynthesis protein [Clostridium beijerinckii]MBA2910856.1 PhzF family phenazine biosynthesis protein [Clostridium beijerinckii]MBA9014131.1 PhzF family phenazine biosynthesis protein [Clostridium beijerinckii]
MARKYNLYQVDSFTKEKFTGNPAGVISNADGLTDYEMQKIARELNNSETAFIFSSNGNEYDVQVRFFTPTSEVPICGHATIAGHYVRAIENELETSRIYHKTGAGILPVDIIKENDDYKIIMTQGKIEFGEIIDGINKEELLKALKIKESDLLDDYKIQIVSTGHSKVMIGIKSIETLNTLQPDYSALSKLSEVIKCNGYYIFTTDSKESDILIHGRMFAPSIGINEDPVTGNANGPLGAYLIHHNLVKHNNSLFRFKAKQGEAINRPGIIEVEVKIEDNEPIEAKVSGNAVIIFKSELLLND